MSACCSTRATSRSPAAIRSRCSTGISTRVCHVHCKDVRPADHQAGAQPQLEFSRRGDQRRIHRARRRRGRLPVDHRAPEAARLSWLAGGRSGTGPGRRAELRVRARRATDIARAGRCAAESPTTPCRRQHESARQGVARRPDDRARDAAIGRLEAMSDSPRIGSRRDEVVHVLRSRARGVHRRAAGRGDDRNGRSPRGTSLGTRDSVFEDAAPYAVYVPPNVARDSARPTATPRSAWRARRPRRVSGAADRAARR